MLKSSPSPVPNALISVLNSSFSRILSIDDFSTFNGFPRRGKIACVVRSRPCFALPPAESPSTINNSLNSGFFPVQEASFPTRFALFIALLLTAQFFRAAYVIARASRTHCLFHNLFGNRLGRFKIQKFVKFLRHELFHKRLDLGIAEFGFRLPFELHVLSLTEITAVMPSR